MTTQLNPSNALPGLFRRNLLINGSGEVNQRADSSALADGTYGHDRWYRLTQSNNIAVSNLTDVEDGTPYMMRLTQSNATPQRMGYAQIIEGKNCKHLRGQTVAFRVGRIRQSTSADVRYAILEWTGTEDSVTSDVVNDWTSGTYTAGNFFLGSNLTVSAVAEQALTANTLTTGSTVTATLGSSFNNLIVFVWTESTVAQNVTLDIGKAQLEVGSVATPYEVLPWGEILVLCQRYHERGGDWTTTAEDQRFRSPYSGAIWWPVRFAVSKRIDATTVNVYAQSSGTINSWREQGTTDVAANASSIRRSGFTSQCSTATDANAYAFTWIADCEL